MTVFEQAECLRETLQELREDARLLHLSLLGAQTSVDKLTLNCFLRLMDYLNQHINDVCILCKQEDNCSAG